MCFEAFIELGVHFIENGDHFHRRKRSTNRGEPDHIAEENGATVKRLRKRKNNGQLFSARCFFFRIDSLFRLVSALNNGLRSLP